eukprot:6173528-Pleurochrysis_carterae.AAC.1
MGQQGKMNKAFQTWRKRLRQEYDEQEEGKEEGTGRPERERGRMEFNTGVELERYRECINKLRSFCKWGLDDFWVGNAKTPGMGASGPLRLISS